MIAGHRHVLDPPAGKHVHAAGAWQAPLNAGAGQLVGESPTQRDGNPNSLSVYRLELMEDVTVAVHRLRFAYSKATGLQRLPQRDGDLLLGLQTH